MAINFDTALGVHADALLLRGKRAEVLANNIANADTPNYKARDFDFAAVLDKQMGYANEMSSVKVATTQAGHMSGFVDPDMAADLMFTRPIQPSIDGNTVEVQEEMAKYTDNALRYQASFRFLNDKFTGLKNAIKGE